MEKLNLKLAPKDWVYISIIGAFFGFLSLYFFYFLNKELQNFQLLFFSTNNFIYLFIFIFFYNYFKQICTSKSKPKILVFD